jgi:hypothetical protein
MRRAGGRVRAGTRRRLRPAPAGQAAFAGVGADGCAEGRAAAPPIDARIRVWFNPQIESRHFMVPGVLALVLLVVTANLSSMAIVREKELGTLEQLNVTPLARWELVVGKLLPYGLIGLVDVLLVTAVAIFWFEVPLRGSFTLLFAMSVLYVFCTLALGPVHLDHLEHAAAGHDDGDVLLPDADDLSLGLHLSDREHAGGDPAVHLPHPAPLLPRHRAGHLPEGHRAGAALAAGGGARRPGARSCWRWPWLRSRKTTG